MLIPTEFAYAATANITDLTLSCEKRYSIFENDEQVIYSVNWNNNGNYYHNVIKWH